MPSAQGATTAAKKKAARPAGSDALLMFALELVGVGLFTIIAGANSQMGTVVLLFMTGLWLLYMITNTAVLTKLEKAMEAA